ncbi:hypothetical protein [Cecembia rubra]|uniref:hypothetical protein n=1 Tax=Cecembia rubra TaxID=1485585 RepID=UPI0027151199|nr:hypothetical protein [Cecembia rubra]
MKYVIVSSELSKNVIRAFFLIILILYSIQQQSYAQVSDRIPRWEIGLDALSLIDKNDLPAYSLFGRFMLNPQAPKKTSLRLRLGAEGYAYLDSAFNEDKVGLDYRVNSFFVSAGIQRELLIFDKSSVYFGADLGYLRKVNLKDYTGDFGWNVVGHDYYRETNLRFAGILGYTHQLGNNFAISVESSLQTIYSHQKQDTDYVSIFNEDNIIISYENSTVKSLQSGITPFYQVLFCYRF